MVVPDAAGVGWDGVSNGVSVEGTVVGRGLPPPPAPPLPLPLPRLGALLAGA